MKDDLKTVSYAAVLGLVCALTLTVADRLTAARKKANAEAEEVRNFLSILDVPFDAEAPAADLVEIFKQNIQVQERGTQTFYVYDHAQSGKLWAVRFTGPGLWGPVEGLLCLKSDLKTIHAVSFYKQEETPGLGGEISSGDFQNQFRGKTLLGPSGAVGIQIVRDGADDRNEVDAISGATMTCDKVQDMLNKLVVQIVKQEQPNGK